MGGKVAKGAVLVCVAAAGFAAMMQSERTLKLRVAVQLFGYDGLAEIVRMSLAERLVGVRPTEARIAFHKLMDTMAEVETKYLGPGRGITSVEDIAEGERFLTHVLRMGLETLLESDVRRPTFTSMVHPTMKTLGDNPDCFYMNAQLDPELSYLVRGRVSQDEVYTSFTLSEAPCRACFASRVMQDVNIFNLSRSGPNNSEYALLISRERPAEIPAGLSWMELKPSKEGNTPQLITRHYFERVISAQNDPLVRPVVSIELAPGQPPPPPMRFPRTDAQVARRLEDVARYVQQHTIEMSNDPKTAPAWFSFTPNVFGPPQSFRENGKDSKDGGGGLGAVDITYSAAPFKLQPGEGLLVEGTFPRCTFANLNLWNRYLQTLEYRFGLQVSLNRKQMKYLDLATGAFRVLVSPTPPSAALAADWLDTLGRLEGTVFLRVILAQEKVLPFRTTLLRVEQP